MGKLILGSWMSCLISPLQTLGSDMSIDLGGAQASMTEERLDATKICPAIEEMGRKGVT